MRQRVITATFFVLAMLGGVYGGIIPFYILIGLIATGCLWEYYGITLPTVEDQITPRRIATTVVTSLSFWLMNAALFDFVDLNYGVIFAVALLAMTFLSPLFELFAGGRHPFTYVAHSIYGWLYIALPLMLISSIYLPSTHPHPNRVMGLLLLTWTNDTLAYVIGSRWGKHKLLERISPKKTWEGTIGGAIFTLGVAGLLGPLMPTAFSPVQWLMLGGVVALFATLGDLVESMLKRSVGVKDSGNLLPGHGGLLDRFDAFIFIAPFVWLLVWWWGG